MAGNWNEPLPLMDQVMCDRIIQRTDEYLTAVIWRNDGEAETLEQAVALAKNGKDVGLIKTKMLRPTNRIFEDWMNWSALVTYLFNRDTNYRTLLSAVRKPIDKAHEIKYVFIESLSS